MCQFIYRARFYFHGIKENMLVLIHFSGVWYEREIIELKKDDVVIVYKDLKLTKGQLVLHSVFVNNFKKKK